MPWFRDPARHALSAKGISTGRFQRAQLEHVQSGNRVGGTFGKASGYDHVVKSLGRKYSEGDEIAGEDYERVIGPIFDTLADGDILADKGDFRGAIAKLELAEHQYSSLCQYFNVARDEDSKEFVAVTRQISDKTIARSHAGAVPQTQVNDKSRGDRDSR